MGRLTFEKELSMVPSIGIMIGCYIITRMLSFLSRKGDRAESGLTKAFAVITILITLLIMVDLFTSGSQS